MEIILLITIDQSTGLSYTLKVSTNLYYLLTDILKFNITN